MKKIIALVLSFSLLCACGKSEAVKTAEEAINAIGTVTANSGDTIANAEKMYGILTDAEKEKVKNRLVLVEAQDAFEDIKGEVVYKNAQNAYKKLQEVANLCVTGMDTIYGAWYFGIYEAKSTSDFDDMAKSVPGFSSNELEKAGKLLGINAWDVGDDWENSLWTAVMAITTRGDYDTITKNMSEAEKVLQSLTDKYDDYTYYPKLKEYYSAIKSYVDFYSNPTGSFSQLADTINDYENRIRTLESDVSFLFNK